MASLVASRVSTAALISVLVTVFMLPPILLLPPWRNQSPRTNCGAFLRVDNRSHAAWRRWRKQPHCRLPPIPGVDCAPEPIARQSLGLSPRTMLPIFLRPDHHANL